MEEGRLQDERIGKRDLSQFLNGALPSYKQDGRIGSTDLAIWSLAIVRRGKEVLVYEKGSFIDGRRIFDDPLSIAFCSPITQNDRTLFDRRYHGVLASAITTVSVDLDLEYSPAFQVIEKNSRLCGGFISNVNGSRFLVIVSEVCLPVDFRVFSRRLAVNNLRWVSKKELGVIGDKLDPWSKDAMRIAGYPE